MGDQGTRQENTMSQTNLEQPKLEELLARFLNRQAQAQEIGLANFGTSSEVLLHDAGPVLPVDAGLAWQSATEALPFFHKTKEKFSAPPSWPNIIANRDPEVAIPFCLGNYPQLMRNFHAILHHGKLGELRPQAGRPILAPALTDWAETQANQFPQILLAIGTMRLANHLESAWKSLAVLENKTPSLWQACLQNEKASILWHQGQADHAMDIWSKMKPTVPVWFNLGMGALFLEKSSQATGPLNQAVEQIPETSSWHHLARLYLTLAQGSTS
jgi:hypothetical protein